VFLSGVLENAAMRLLLAFCAIALLSAACERKDSAKSKAKQHETTEVETDNTPSEEPPAARPVENERTIRLVPDRSLTVKEYIDAGMPEIDEKWQVPQYEFAVKTLTKIAARDVAQLPRADSPRSGKLFRRMVATDNFDAVRSSGFALAEQVRNLQEVGHNLDAIMKIYENAQKDGRSFDAEMVQLNTNAISFCVVAYSTIDDALAELPPDDEHRNPDHPFWRGIQDRLVAGLNIALDGLGPTKSIRPAQRVLLAKGLQKHWPALSPRLNESAQNEMRNRLTQMAETETDPQVKQALKRMSEFRPPAKEKP
jgi:hypothetical protein